MKIITNSPMQEPFLLGHALSSIVKQTQHALSSRSGLVLGREADQHALSSSSSFVCCLFRVCNSSSLLLLLLFFKTISVIIMPWTF